MGEGDRVIGDPQNPDNNSIIRIWVDKGTVVLDFATLEGERIVGGSLTPEKTRAVAKQMLGYADVAEKQTHDLPSFKTDEVVIRRFHERMSGEFRCRYCYKPTSQWVMDETCPRRTS